MSSLTDSQVRHMILELLYQKSREDSTGFGIERPEMLKRIEAPANIIDFNIQYLEEKYLIKLENYCGAPWGFARITSFGIDVVEDKEKYTTQFPFINTIIHVQGNNYGNIVQAANSSTINFSQNISNAFKEAYERIERKGDLSQEQKEEITNKTKLLEEELGKPEKDAGRIQQYCKWLKQNANWIIPTLTQVVTEGIKIACGIP